MSRQINLQDAFLNGVRKQKIPVTIHVTNGYQINNAIVLGYDSFVVLAECAGKEMLIYKSAISTITPSVRLELTAQNREE